MAENADFSKNLLTFTPRKFIFVLLKRAKINRLCRTLMLKHRLMFKILNKKDFKRVLGKSTGFNGS